MRKGFLLREKRLGLHPVRRERGKRASNSSTYERDPKQYTNLAILPEFKPVVDSFKTKLAAKLVEVRDNDLGLE